MFTANNLGRNITALVFRAIPTLDVILRQRPLKGAIKLRAENLHMITLQTDTSLCNLWFRVVCSSFTSLTMHSNIIDEL